MKIPPQIYAKTLVESASNDNLEKLSQNFWILLQKNKQYRDLNKILDALDTESAAKENKQLVKIYSKDKLDEETLSDIKNKIFVRFSSSEARSLNGSSSRPLGSNDIILKNITGKNITGIIAKMDDKYIDLTVEEKVKRIKKIFNNQ